MHASMAYINGAGLRCQEGNDLELLKTLLSSAARESPALREKGKSKDERQAEEESKHDTASKPGGHQNDPNDPTNPNEVRERYLKKIDKKINR
jgi:hypothetical protein